MLNNPNIQTDPAEALRDLADDYGHTPFILYDDRNTFDEYTGHFSAAPAFVNAVIAEAEPLFQAGNRIGVQGTMIELHCWLDALNMSDAWEIMQDTFLNDDWDEDDSDDEDDPGSDRETDGETDRYDDPHAAVIRAMDRANEAAERYAVFLSDRREDDDLSEVTCWRVMAMPCGHMAALEHHIAQLRRDQPRNAESHNAAIHVSLQTLAHALHHLEQLRREKRAGIGPSKRAMNRRIGQVRSAITKAAGAQELLARTMSITLSDGVREDKALREAARQLGERLRSGPEPFLIEITDNRNWENTLLAYRNPNGSVRVKRIVDHYDLETHPGEAVDHALTIRNLGLQLSAQNEENADAFLDLAGLIRDNAEGALHHVDRGEFSLFLSELRLITDDPHAVREAALVALSEEYTATDLLFAQAEPPVSTVSGEQARSVIDAGRSAGLNDGQLRALAAAMGQQPVPLGVAAPSASGEQIAHVLELAPEPLSSRQAHRIAILLGLEDPNDESVLNWVMENAYDLLAGDDLDMDDDDYDAYYEED